MTGPVFFIKTPSLGDCQTIIKIESPAHEIETIAYQPSKWYSRYLYGISSGFG